MRPALPVFDCGALFSALDAQRRDRGLDWTLSPTPCGSSRQDSTPKEWIVRCALERLYGYHNEGQPLASTGCSCCDGYAVRQRTLDGPGHRCGRREVTVGRNRESASMEPEPGIHSAERGTPYVRSHVGKLADELNCTPSRLTNLRTARLADMDLAMRITQWLGQPAAGFIHPAQW